MTCLHLHAASTCHYNYSYIWEKIAHLQQKTRQIFPIKLIDMQTQYFSSSVSCRMALTVEILYMEKKYSHYWMILQLFNFSLEMLFLGC